MPLLYLSGTAEAMGLGNALTLRLRVAQTVGRVLLNQSSEGGFGLWGRAGAATCGLTPMSPTSCRGPGRRA